ncbi:basic secretory protein-like protein [Haloferula sp. BvORR071]|uniref:basic secretory protein-like protein n=1 Tax=Haloferula sp. BvORR071 TaxID=1396141 RepID=UPI0006962D67|nr:basic secretory protein-like protein [Haloferula sp. BvORR071]
MRSSSAASLLIAAASIAATSTLHAAANVTKGHGQADAEFKLDTIAPPATNDAATKATFTLVDGEKDRGSAELSVLNDGKVPTGDDQPRANFFFTQGSQGGRIAVDLGEETPIKSVDTYSWHNGSRGPQVYKLYAASGKAKDFNAAPKRDTDPKSVGWDLVAEVDTRVKDGNGGGQHAAEVTNQGGKVLGDYRYLLFDVEPTSKSDPFGNTFFSEIDVISSRGPAIERLKVAEKIVKEYKSKDGKFRYIINSTKAPELTDWSDKELVPVIQEWYPKLVELMPSQGYKAPDVVTFLYDPTIGPPAFAQGGQITLNAKWFAGELNREAKGATVHEMGHVVQNYWRASQTNRNPKPTPGWVTEGVCDYIRWFLYEPQSHGAGLGPDRAEKVNYDNSYRTTGNFLDWVVTSKDKDLMQKLNAAGREGKYEEGLWKEWTGKTLPELNTEWKEAIKAGKRVQK